MPRRPGSSPGRRRHGHGAVDARELASPLVEAHLLLDVPAATQVGDEAVYGLDVPAQALGELPLGAGETARDDGLGGDRPQELLLGLREAALLGAASGAGPPGRPLVSRSGGAYASAPCAGVTRGAPPPTHIYLGSRGRGARLPVEAVHALPLVPAAGRPRSRGTAGRRSASFGRV